MQWFVVSFVKVPVIFSLSIENSIAKKAIPNARKGAVKKGISHIQNIGNNKSDIIAVYDMNPAAKSKTTFPQYFAAALFLLFSFALYMLLKSLPTKSSALTNSI